MKRSALLVLVLLLALAAGLGFLWLNSRSSGPTGSELVQSPDGGAASALPAPAQPDELESAAQPASAERAAALPEKEPTPQSRQLQGSVRIPTGVDESGALTIYALAQRASYREIVREIAGAAEARAEPMSGKRDEGQRILAQASVAKDGRFTLELPEGTQRAYLALQGRFLYLERTLEVELARKRELQLVPRVGARVTGTITLPEGTPPAALAGVEVELAPVLRGAMMMNAESLARRRPKPSGAAFEVRAVPVDCAWRLQLTSADFASVERTLENLRGGQTRELALALEPGGTLRGVVRTSSGEPCPGAKVMAASEGEWFGVDDREVRSATSAADGSFELPHVPAGKLKLQAEHEGHLSSPKVDVELPAGRVTEGVVLVLREGASVAGALRWSDASPAAGVEVRASFDLSQAGGLSGLNALEGAEGKAKTDAQGNFEIRGLGKGPFTLRASAKPKDAAEGADELGARADGVTPGTRDLVLVLRAGSRVRGHVLDDAGQPVTKFHVRLQHEGKGMFARLGQDSQEQSFEDPAGKFAVGGLSDGGWKLWVSAENFASSAEQSLKLPEAPDAPECEVVLPRASRVSGRVLSAAGEAVAGADVRVDSGGPDWQRKLSGAPPDPEAQSDDGGNFHLEGLRPGRVSLVASARDAARGEPVTLELVAGEEQKDVVLRLRNGGSISGEVYDEGGKPLSGLTVQVTEMAQFSTHMENTDGEGRFRLEHLVPGNYQVVAFSARNLSKLGGDAGSDFMSGMKTASASVKDGEDTHVVLGAPPADPVEVVGRVTHAGQPYGGALVTFIHEGKDVLSKMKNVTVDAQGAFTVRLDEPGRYSVSVQRLAGGMGQQNTVEFTRQIPKEKRCELLLEMPTGRVSGRVSGPEGNPAPGERVTMHPRSALIGGTMWGGAYIETQTDAEGRYDIQTLRPGDYVLTAGGMQMGGIFGAEAAHGRELRSDIRVAEGDWLRDVDFRLRKPGKVDVNVVGEDGKPIAKAAIFVRDAAGNLLDRFSMTVSDETGLAHYGGLAPGEYSFSSRMDVRASAEGARVKLGEGEAKSVQLVLQGATMLLVQIVDAQGEHVQAPVSVVDEAGREVAGMYGLNEIMELFGKNGVDFDTARVGPLPPGKYKVSAQTEDGRKGSKPVTLTGQPERKLTLRVE